MGKVLDSWELPLSFRVQREILSFYKRMMPLLVLSPTSKLARLVGDNTNKGCRKQYKLLLLTFCILHFTFYLHAQTFTYTPGDSLIPDYGNAKAFSLPVPSLDSSYITANYGVKTVCVNIRHPRVSDLGVYLVAPDGTQIELTSGASGADYDHTCFNMAAGTTILSGTAPYTGTYYPRHNIGDMNNGQNGVGVWRLFVQDLVLGDTGYVRNWSLAFDTAAPAPSGTPIGSCSIFSPQGCVCADSAQSNCWLLPDMFIGYTWLSDPIHRQEFHDSLRVSNSTANAGFGPMEIIGTGMWYCGDSLVSGSLVCPNGQYSRQLVRQRVYVKTNNGYFDFIDTMVGTMSFHAELGHHHLHVDDWTQNTLRIRGPESDPSLWQIVGSGFKSSTNLYDHVHCDDLFVACDYGNKIYTDSNLKNAGLGAGYSSGSVNVQGISVGYADIYENNLLGQAIYFDSLCNGDYYMVAQFDPHHRFVDMNRSNDVTIAPITLTLQRPNCCHTNFEIDTVNFSTGSFRFIDRSIAMPNSWRWEFGDGDTSTEQFPYHQYQHSGNYTVKLFTKTAQGCSDATALAITSVYTTGIKEIAHNLSFQVYPNPSKELFNLQMNLLSEENLSIELFDVLGEKIKTIADHQFFVSGENKLPFSLSQSGVYVLRIKSEQQFWYQKMVVE